MKKHIVIIGGGFAGINFIKAVAKSNEFSITLVDRNNYHFFPPLIYQVATAFIEPSHISYPFRKLFSNYDNVHYYMGSFLSIDTNLQIIETDNGKIVYDHAIFALGTETNFFGLDHVQECALPMKTINEALYIKNHLLLNLEKASRNNDENKAERLQNIVIAGGGPTGVELAGMIAEMGAFVAEKEYPEIELNLSHLYLIDALPSLLAPMSDAAKKTAYDNLKRLGVNILLNVSVKDYVEGNVILSDGRKIKTETLIWTSGVIGREVLGIPETSIGKGRRLLVDEYNRVLGFNNVWALGDICLQLTDKNYPKGHPQLAQVAIQQAKLAAKNFIKLHHQKPLQSFVYKDKGSMAIISKYKAVVDLPKFSYTGFFAWLTWLFIHIIPLTGFRNRVRLALEWFRLFITNNPSIRMILQPGKNGQNNKN
ncbi:MULTISPECIES: NAD(P)/FAD-dependent oxidoreductase [Chryseobacterium]|uniref:NADH:ubiquinone reductase (non-electrogenic) n=2 Tax=Chryseobacterium TaxID=59732 RepID=A0A1M5GZ90_9FLAO|nr:MULTISPECIES: NAD(P)/FAD-dependent oxidoreductase [Chryseobacterium]MDR6525453.1 NADH dehydrogenase [Chryseobacterium rhizosphaerae]SHG09051.1 NADH dehydrogenase [Chryseobacterium vrystaatense]